MFTASAILSEQEQKASFKASFHENFIPKYVNPNTFEINLPSDSFAQIITTKKETIIKIL